ncbi:hypothetical protein SLE2022_200030 [Rubroshorea leprosula]
MSQLAKELHNCPLMATNSSPLIFSMFLLLPLFLLSITSSGSHHIREATVEDLQLAFKQNKITSRQLVKFYLKEIQKLNPSLRGVIEVNPDALDQADKADKERQAKAKGSYALLGSIVPQDAGVVAKLRRAGAIILGKASMSEWASFRSLTAPDSWSARGGQGKNPYVLTANPCGSSSGSAISVTSNMVAVSLGTETDGSILCPASANSVVGIKPTVGLTSRAGVIPISHRQDTIGPICRTVSDAVYVLDAIAGLDYNDKATRKASRHIPYGGYKQFIKPHGLKGKRLGIVRNPFFDFPNGSALTQAFESHFNTLREQGAVLVDNLEIANVNIILNFTTSGEAIALLAEFKLSLNAYLKELMSSPVQSLADVIAFNQNFSDLEMIKEFPQDIFLAAEATNGIGDIQKAALESLANLSKNGFEKLMKENKLDAMVTTIADTVPVLAIGGFPGISVPAGYDNEGVPFGI